MIVSKKPPAYRGRVHWYVGDWDTNVYHLFSTKHEALAYVRTVYRKKQTIGVHVDWFDVKTDPKVAVSSTASFVDHRSPGYDKNTGTY